MSNKDQDDVGVKANLLMVLINGPEGLLVGLDFTTKPPAESEEEETKKGA